MEKEFIYIVKKNADFTEGRGPMLFHKPFVYEADAIAYVMDQQGIFGSKQGESVSYNRPNLRHFNGYEIEKVELLYSYEKIDREKLETEKAELEARLALINKELRG